MSVLSGQSVTVEFTTSNPTTQAAVNADSLPTAVLVKNGVDDAATVTVTNVTTGRYKAQVTLPSLAPGDFVELAVSATVSTIAGKAIVWRETKDIAIDPFGGVTGVVSHAGTAQSGSTSTTLKLDATGSSTADLYTGQLLFLTTGTGQGQARTISGYNGTTKVATVDRAWLVTPDATTTFVIMGDNRLTSAGADPLAATVPGSYAAGTAGYVLGTNLDALVSTRLPTGSYTAPDNATIALIYGVVDTEVAAIKAKTDQLRFTIANQVDANDLSGGGGGGGASLADILAGITSDHGAGSYIRNTEPDNTTIGQIYTVVGQIYGAVDTEVAAIKAKTDNLPASPAAVGDVMKIDQSQAVAMVDVTSDLTLTVGKALLGAWVQAAGVWDLIGTTLTLKNPNGTTFRTFELDSTETPTERV